MLMSEKHCAYCKSILFDDDDVVVCPECGAPHHRACYDKLGHCAEQEHHGEPAEIQPADTAQEPGERDIPPEGINRNRTGHTCKNCGMISTSDTLFCPYCGNKFDEDEVEPPHQRMPLGVGNMRVDPLGGVDPKAQIDGVDAEDIALYVRVNTGRYVPLFEHMHKNKRKVHWNWAAFLLPQPWLLLRKCYLAGFISCAAAIISSLMSMPALQFVANYIESMPVAASALEASQLQYQAVTNMPLSLQLLVIGSALLSLAVRIIVGLFGDKLYKNKVLDKIHSIYSNDEIDDKKGEVFRVGSINIWLAILAFMSTFFNFF